MNMGNDYRSDRNVSQQEQVQRDNLQNPVQIIRDMTDSLYPIYA